jgi:hypothetical protein
MLGCVSVAPRSFFRFLPPAMGVEWMTNVLAVPSFLRSAETRATRPSGLSNKTFQDFFSRFGFGSAGIPHDGRPASPTPDAAR